MIRNIEDLKKNKLGQRHDGDFSGYLAEEELLELIGQVEAGEMLHAPRQLKGNVFAQIRHERREVKKRQVFIYRAKVFAAMAAALAVLIFMPDDRTESVLKAPVEQQAEDDLARRAQQRQKDIDSNWERYLEGRERGGMKGFFEDINEKVAQFGEGLHNRVE